MEHYQQPNREPKLQAWETTVLTALRDPAIISQQGDVASIDCALLERTLAAATRETFIPQKSIAITERLEALGIHCLKNFDSPAANLFVQPRQYFDTYMQRSSADFYNGVLSNPHCALYLAPSLVTPLIYSNARDIATQVFAGTGGVLTTLSQDVLSSAAYSGLLGELRRNLLLHYVASPSSQPERFDRYAKNLPSSEGDFHRPFFVDHARRVLAKVLMDNRELPAEMTPLLDCSCGTRLFTKFPHALITPWLQRNLHETSKEFSACLEMYQRTIASDQTSWDSEPSSDWEELSYLHSGQNIEDEFEMIDDLIAGNKSRFSACLDLLLFADQGCPAFHAMHVQFDPLNKSNPILDESDAESYLNPPLPSNSELLQTLTHCTSSMLSVLGHPGLCAELEMILPNRISEAMRERFRWFPDEYSAFTKFYEQDVANCFMRFIDNFDFQSAISLIVIAPTSATPEGLLAIPPEIEDSIDRYQNLICQRIAQKAGVIYEAINETSPLFKWSNIERDMAELQRAISTFIKPTHLHAGDPDLSPSLAKLVVKLALRNQSGRDGKGPTSNDRGFEMAYDLLQSLGREGGGLAKHIFSSAIATVPLLKQEFSGYITACNLLAADILKEPKSAHEQLTFYERRLTIPIKLFLTLPSAVRSSSIASPMECVRALREMRRGREMRERIADIERSAEPQPRLVNNFDLNNLLGIYRERKHRQGEAPAPLPLETSRSILQILARGGIAPDKDFQITLGAAERAIAIETFLAEPEKGSTITLNRSSLEQIFATESAVMTSVRLTFKNGLPVDVIASSDLAATFYEVASTRIRREDQVLAASLQKVSKVFGLLSEHLRNLKLKDPENPTKRDQARVLRLLRNFSQEKTIQQLIRELHLD